MSCSAWPWRCAGGASRVQRDEFGAREAHVRLNARAPKIVTVDHACARDVRSAGTARRSVTQGLPVPWNERRNRRSLPPLDGASHSAPLAQSLRGPPGAMFRPGVARPVSFFPVPPAPAGLSGIRAWRSRAGALVGASVRSLLRKDRTAAALQPAGRPDDGARGWARPTLGATRLRDRAMRPAAGISVARA